jgi:hypothetical protein
LLPSARTYYDMINHTAPIPAEYQQLATGWCGTFNFRVVNGTALYKVEDTDRGFAIRRLAEANDNTGD